ncbi:partial FO synthase, partial [Methanosarcinales archaeon]
MYHPGAELLSPDEVKDILLKGARAGCSEALFTFGERPGEVPGFRELLLEFGYE